MAYFYFLFYIFKSFCAKNYITVNNTYLDKINNERYYSFHFITMQLPCFNEFRKLFCELGKKKIIPVNIYDLLTPRELSF